MFQIKTIITDSTAPYDYEICDDLYIRSTDKARPAPPQVAATMLEQGIITPSQFLATVHDYCFYYDYTMAEMIETAHARKIYPDAIILMETQA